ncbi:hypothetical protein HDR58_10720 [bacterium]|nr:hypothetical protein [bacterium]
MKEYLKLNTEENPTLIILGVLGLYFLIAGFILYLFLLHRISLSVTLMLCGVFTAIYFPRFLVIKKIITKDDIKIIDDSIIINNRKIDFAEIIDFKVKIFKPQVIFFFNNKMLVFQEAKMMLQTNSEQIPFSVIGTEKIRLLQEFLSHIIH